MTLNVLIVDDEPLAREGVQLLLKQESDISIVGECGSGAEAIRAILKLQPDLVFLDVKMPRVNGFQVIDAIGPENMPAVIFLTAYEQHAVEAFQVNALDYLLKPIDAERFHDSLSRAREEISRNSIAEKAQQFRALLDTDGATGLASHERIMVRSSGHVYFLRPAQVHWIEASGDYVTIHAAGRQHLVRDTMQRMGQRLATQGFKRIHRSAIVNLEYIAELIPNDSGDYQVVLVDGTILKLSRTYRDELYAVLKA